ncbi:MAG TPA: hypothetical protein VFI18_05710 [Gaiellales bacterium]|nr:hypothetical protein [Gaiellales bacterium]
MTEHDHDEVARRLRETGTVSAPERLRAEVMDQVRAEPRLRPSRRSLLMPVLPYAAAAAAVLAALVLAVSHLGGSGSSGGAAGGGGASGANFSRSSPSPSKDATGGAEALGAQKVFRVPAGALESPALAPFVKAHTASQNTVVIAVPSTRLHQYRQRLSAIEKRTRGDDTVRVILQPKR